MTRRRVGGVPAGLPSRKPVAPAPHATDSAPPDFPAAIAQLRAIVARSGDALLIGEGEANPDRHLLELCAETLEYCVASNRCLAAWRAAVKAYMADRSCQRYPSSDGEAHRLEKMTTPLMRRIGKIPATTPAGIYAKAAVVRASRSGCRVLAQSLAADLIGNPVLRAALWPAQASV